MSTETRLGRLTALQQSQGLDAVLLTTPGNLFYFSGFRTSLYTRFNGLVCAAGAEPVLITSYVDEQIVKKEIWGPVWIRDVRIYGPIERADVVPLYTDALKPALRAARRIGVDAIGLRLAREIEAAFPDCELMEISAELARIRLQKEPGEIEKIRRASQIGIACLETAREILSRPGVTELDLGAELEYQARRQGADGWGYPILISTGEKLAAPHAPPLPVAIDPEAPFVRIGFAPTFEGYTTSLLRTYCRKPDALTVRYERAFFEAISDLCRTLRPGTTVQDILSAVAASYESSGVRNAWGGDMGYSLGVEVQEPPRIGGTDASVIEAGTVLALMPGLRRAGEATFHHSDIYVVNDDGCELVSNGLQGLVVYG
jgi:Xaa-Pro dipeptidase